MSSREAEDRILAAMGRSRARRTRTAELKSEEPPAAVTGPVTAPTPPPAPMQSDPSPAKARGRRLQDETDTRVVDSSLLDPESHHAWEQALVGGEAERWQAIKVLLTRSGPDLRWRALGWIARQEIGWARETYLDVRNVQREPWRADLIRQNGVEFRAAIERLERRFAESIPFLDPLLHLLDGMELDLGAVESCRASLRRVAGRAAWVQSWLGVDGAKGGGVPGYDSDEGVARVKAQVRAAHAAYNAKAARSPDHEQAGTGDGRAEWEFGWR